MIELIALSTAIAFSVNDGVKYSPCKPQARNCFEIGPTTISCQAFEEVFNFDWEETDCRGFTDVDAESGECKKKKITSRTLLGLCQDGVVRWKEEK